MRISCKKTFIAAFALIALVCGGCVSACDKIDADDPKFTGGQNGSQTEEPDTDTPTPEEPGDDDPSIDDPSNDNPSSDDPNFKPAEDLYTVLIPDDIPSQTKMYTGFFLSFNKDNKTPNYVSWELTKDETNYVVDRKDDWWKDPDIEGCPTKDYQYSIYGYQRGHMCPSADQRWSAQAQKDCCVMANICPQLGSLNEKAWATLEGKERDWARRDGAIWIICGPIYEETDTQRIGVDNVRVPSAFFKTFLYYNGDKSRAIAFVYPHMSATGTMESYAMSVDDLESILNYDFFSALPDDIEKKVEAEFSFREWNK